MVKTNYNMAINEKTQLAINALKFEAIFVSNPTEQTHNCKDFHKTSFKWLCKITLGTHTVEVDYHMGIHHSRFNTKRGGHFSHDTLNASEFEQYKNKGLSDAGFRNWLEHATPKPPELDEILSSLTSEADAINENFEDWAESLGYDSDSIKALKMWNECCNSYRKLKSLNLDLEKLQKFYENF